ncbi:MAG: hypothetical protein U0470_04560 [Anaerolineae bacterium]
MNGSPSSAPPATLADIAYRDDDLMAMLGPDGLGFTLVPRTSSADADLADPASWRAEPGPGGSPGAEDAPTLGRPGDALGVLCASAAPYEDAVEIANPSASPVEISGWYLVRRRPTGPASTDCPALRMAAGGSAAGVRTRLRALAAPDRAFGLSSDGESVSPPHGRRGRPDDGLRAASHLRPGGRLDLVRGRTATAPASTSPPSRRRRSGPPRRPTSTPFRAGQGAPNAPPALGPAVISEVLAVPPRGRAAWIELRNLTDAALPIGGDPASGTGPWAGSRAMPASFRPAPCCRRARFAVVLAEDPADHAAAPAVPPDVPLFGPWTGVVSAAGGRLALVRPRAGQSAGVAGPWVRVDGVRWDQAPPWAIPTMLIGASLERRGPSGGATTRCRGRRCASAARPASRRRRSSRAFVPWAQVRR